MQQTLRAPPVLLPGSFGFALQQIRPICVGGVVSPLRIWSEALIRPHPLLYPEGPAAFIEHLYESYAVASVDRMVVRRLTNWQLTQARPTDLNINAHPRALEDDEFVELVLRRGRRLAEAGHGLCLELIEFGECHHKRDLIASATRLRQAGIQIALDDFGSRMNCFDLCGEGIVDFIKIHIAITRQLPTNRNQRAVVRGIVKMAEGLGAEVIAEGIEQKAQLDVLRDLGVGYAQGYLLHRPTLMEEA